MPGAYQLDLSVPGCGTPCKRYPSRRNKPGFKIAKTVERLHVGESDACFAWELTAFCKRIANVNITHDLSITA